MKGNIKRVLAASGLLVAALMIVVSVLPGSTALAAGTNQQDDVVKCVNGQLILYERVDTGQKDAKGHIIWKVTGQQVLGTCTAGSNGNVQNSSSYSFLLKLGQQYGMNQQQVDALIGQYFGQQGLPANFNAQAWWNAYVAGQNGMNNQNNNQNSNNSNNGTNYSSWSNEQILNFMAKRFGLTRAQLDVLIAAYFGQQGIPASFDLQGWFAGYMNGQNSGLSTSLNSNSSASNSTSSNNTSSNNTGSYSTSGSSTTQASTTGTNQQGQSGQQGQASNNNGTTNNSTSSNGGVGGASAPSTLPTTGGGLNTVSPLVLAFGTLLVLLGLSAYKVSATR